MATKLKKLVITKVALCEEGACSAAHIKLFKKKEATPMTYEEIFKSLTPEQQAVLKAKETEMQGKVDTAEAAKKQAEDDKKKAEEKVKEMENAAPAPKKTDEELMKSLTPELQALFKSQQAKIAAAEAIAKAAAEEQETALAKTRVSVLKSIPGEEAEKMELLKSLNSKDSALAQKVFETLEKANAVIEKSAAFDATGAAGGDQNLGSADDCYAAIEKAAEPIALAKNISKEAAVSEVLKTRPDLYQAYIKALN